MKASQKFLRVPVIMYDSLSLRNALDTEEKFEESLNMAVTYHEPVESVVGFYSIKFEDVDGWSDTYTREKTIEQIKKDGFNATEVYLRNDPPIVCPISSKEFARMYDELGEQLLLDRLQNEESVFAKSSLRKNWLHRFLS